jgi:hypothetical protein
MMLPRRGRSQPRAAQPEPVQPMRDSGSPVNAWSALVPVERLVHGQDPEHTYPAKARRIGEDMKANGQRRPIDAGYSPQHGLFSIVDGHHRHLGAQFAGLPDVRVKSTGPVPSFARDMRPYETEDDYRSA